MDAGVPGTFNRMADMLPPKMAPAKMPPSMIMPLSALIRNVTGTNKAIARVAVKPGMAPKMMPIMTPPARTPISFQRKLRRLRFNRPTPGSFG